MATQFVVVYAGSSRLTSMEYQKVTIELKIEHIELLDKLKNEYGAQSRSRALEMLLDDLLKPEA